MLEISEQEFYIDNGKGDKTPDPKFMPKWRAQDEGLRIEVKASNLHNKMTKLIVDNLGNESGYDGLSDIKKYERVKEVMLEMNDRLGWGLDYFDIEARSLKGVVLSINAQRFNKSMEIDYERHGENSLIHSLHAANDNSLKLYEANIAPALKETYEFRKYCVAGGRAASEHDMDELLREMLTLGQAATQNVNKDNYEATSKKAKVSDEPLQSQLVKRAALLAAEAVETRDFEKFFKTFKDFVDKHDIRTEGPDIINIFIEQTEGRGPKNERGKRFAVENADEYLVTEGFKKDPSHFEKFIQSLTKLAENMQGTRHLNRFAKLVVDPNFPERLMFRDDSNKVDVGRINYVDRSPGKLLNLAEGEIEQAIAKNAVYDAYIGLSKCLKMQNKYIRLKSATNDNVDAESLVLDHNKEGIAYVKKELERRNNHIENAVSDPENELSKLLKRIQKNPENVEIYLKRALVIAGRDDNLKGLSVDRNAEQTILSVDQISHIANVYEDLAMKVKRGLWNPSDGQKVIDLEKLPIKVERAI